MKWDMLGPSVATLNHEMGKIFDLCLLLFIVNPLNGPSSLETKEMLYSYVNPNHFNYEYYSMNDFV